MRKDALTPTRPAPGTARVPGLPPPSGRRSSSDVAGPDVMTLSSTSSLSRPGSSFSSEFGRSGLIETRNARVQAEHHLQLLKARVAKLAFEEERALKTAHISKLRAEEVKQLREEAEARRHKRREHRESMIGSLAENAEQRANIQRAHKEQQRAKVGLGRFWQCDWVATPTPTPNTHTCSRTCLHTHTHVRPSPPPSRPPLSPFFPPHRLQRWRMVLSRQDEARQVKEQSKRNAEQAKKNNEDALRHAKHLRQTIVDPVADR